MATLNEDVYSSLHTLRQVETRRDELTGGELYIAASAAAKVLQSADAHFAALQLLHGRASRVWSHTIRCDAIKL